MEDGGWQRQFNRRERREHKVMKPLTNEELDLLSGSLKAHRLGCSASDSGFPQLFERFGEQLIEGARRGILQPGLAGQASVWDTPAYWLGQLSALEMTVSADPATEPGIPADQLVLADLAVQKVTAFNAMRGALKQMRQLQYRVHQAGLRR